MLRDKLVCKRPDDDGVRLISYGYLSNAGEKPVTIPSNTFGR